MGVNLLFIQKLLDVLLAGVMLVVLAGCANESIVLVPDPDGHVGKAEVTTDGGKQVLDKANDMTKVSGRSSPPSTVTTADPAFIKETFGEALAVEPQPKDSFTLYFESGTTELTSASKPLIDAIVSDIKRRSAISVSISGHTDATGSDELNNALALDRAKAVQELLLQQGVKPELITVTSHGKGNPAIQTPEGVAEPRNRRVVVIVH
jgi:outer membrane protein OmpA-like peptidoglycan-associated protein